MPWELTDDLESFTTAAGAYLRSRPVAHTTLLTLVETLRRRGLTAYGEEAPLFGTWRDHRGVVAGALLQTPPHPVVFGEVPPEAVTEAVGALAGRSLPGVNLAAERLDLFVEPWVARTGCTTSVFMRVRLYRLERLVPPAVGDARPARPEDRALLIEWVRAFFDEIGEPVPDAGAVVDEALADEVVTVGVASGEPVSMVLRTLPTCGVVRIRNVFTPAARRGRGHAGAATATACVAALDDGASEVVLFTDLDNPTSNGLYQRLGFRPIQDRTVVTFA